jgi:hypothetical protein
VRRHVAEGRGVGSSLVRHDTSRRHGPRIHE